MRYAKAVDERRIFRDIVNEKYDPFELEHAGVHYNTKTLLDPMKHDLEKVFDASVVRCSKLRSMHVFFVKAVVSTSSSQTIQYSGNVVDGGS